MYFSSREQNGKSYYILNHSYWDKKLKKFKKKRMYLGEFGLVTSYHLNRIKLEWDIKKLTQEQIDDLQTVNTAHARRALENILPGIRPEQTQVSKRLYNLLCVLNQMYPGKLDQMNIRYYVDELYRKFYVVRADESKCLYWYAKKNKYCQKEFSNTPLFGKLYPYCNEHMKKKGLILR